MSSSYKDLRVGQQGMKLAVQVYSITNSFPKSELYRGISDQIRRAAVSIPSNIARDTEQIANSLHTCITRADHCSSWKRRLCLLQSYST